MRILIAAIPRVNFKLAVLPADRALLRLCYKCKMGTGHALPRSLAEPGVLHNCTEGQIAKKCRPVLLGQPEVQAKVLGIRLFHAAGVLAIYNSASKQGFEGLGTK